MKTYVVYGRKDGIQVKFAIAADCMSQAKAIAKYECRQKGADFERAERQP